MSLIARRNKRQKFERHTPSSSSSMVTVVVEKIKQTEKSRKMSERPTSRRGGSNGNNYEQPSSSPLGLVRPGTAIRGGTNNGIIPNGRPQSSMRTGTASRIASSMGHPPPTASGQRIGTALGYAGNVSINDSF